MKLTRIYDTLPLVFVLRPSFAVVSPRRHPYADIDQREYILVEQPVRRQILGLLSVYEHITSDGHKLVQPLQIAKQAGRERSNERA
jgi:hypothetical protein